MRRRRWFGPNVGPSAYLFVLPALLLYVGFVIFPLLQTFQISFTDWDGLRRSFDWVGLENYERLVDDARLRASLVNNLIWVVGSWIPQAFGLTLAALLASQWLVGRTFYRAVFFIPVTLSLVVVGVIWDFIYNPLWGALNAGLRAIGLDALTHAWLGEQVTALPALINAANWTYFGFAMVVFLAGIQNIAPELYEVASLDGANARQRFRHVTLPGLRNQITLLLVLSFINTLRQFDLVFVMTSGGPGRATEVIGYYIYTLVQLTRQVGYGSAVAILLTVIVLIAAIVFIRLRERE